MSNKKKSPRLIKKTIGLPSQPPANEEEFIQRFKTYSDIWPIRMQQSIDSNLDLFMSESTGMGEYLGSLLTGIRGTSSAGSGYDLYDSERKKAIEIKLASWVRSPECNNNKCKAKILFWHEKCIHCGSTDLRYPSDSRWMIDATAGIDYKGTIEKYILQVVKPLENSSNCREFLYEAFSVDSNNPNFVEYFTNQKKHSKKSSKCNLLPYSYDFYRADPMKIVSLKISINETDSTITPIYYDVYNRDPEKMDLEKCTCDILRGILTKMSIPFKKSWNKSKLINLVNQYLNETVETKNLPIKKKNYNKDRGYTNRNSKK
jgi:hypothetical protein